MIGNTIADRIQLLVHETGKGTNSSSSNNINNKEKAETETEKAGTVSVEKADTNAQNAISNTSTPANATNPYENSIKQVAKVSTVEEFWSIYDYLIRPNDLPTTTDYHFFRHGIKPTWEDPQNQRGGKWIVRLRKGLASRYWEEIILALIGCQFTGIPDGEVCGAVVSIRYSEDIVSVWNRTASDREITERLRDAIKRILQLPTFVHMEYKPHETSLQDNSSFRNTQVWKPKSAIERESSSPAGAGSTSLGTTSIRKSGSWGEREELRGGTKNRRDTERSWR
eukprot:CAMPEP_0184860558 /NCGR_PEP_ID=MMETSP0580-20130426/5422_1 /TAXON_ID=1118495 /ORGANISM="Dactyliosolen fragilissimus" /LENGTH=281 /DNA_ID=CAMNT_0027357705 /DNA_START=709 /DNA_END=1555 /DNA_ORIENTATION=+